MISNRKISIIACIGEYNEIGYKGHMPWGLFSHDLKRFKEITIGSTIVMGSSTFKSIGSKPLPDRDTIVLSRNIDYLSSIVTDNVHVATSIADAIDMFCKDVFIIGGAEIYKQTIDIADTMYITKIYKSFDYDASFPDINNEDWFVKHNEDHAVKPFDYSFLEYKRLN